jgi:hypothetical protein
VSSDHLEPLPPPRSRRPRRQAMKRKTSIEIPQTCRTQDSGAANSAVPNRYRRWEPRPSRLNRFRMPRDDSGQSSGRGQVPAPQRLPPPGQQWRGLISRMMPTRSLSSGETPNSLGCPARRAPRRAPGHAGWPAVRASNSRTALGLPPRDPGPRTGGVAATSFPHTRNPNCCDPLSFLDRGFFVSCAPAAVKPLSPGLPKEPIAVGNQTSTTSGTCVCAGPSRLFAWTDRHMRD